MPTRTDKGTVVVDLSRCLGCRTCEMACAKGHAGFKDIVEAVLAGADLTPRVHVVAAGGKAVPVQCQHCQDAPCVAVCPSGALYRDEAGGVVRANVARCIGCKSCVVVCPFGAVEIERKGGRVFKCDMCENTIAEGEDPLCVAACPTRARVVTDLEELSARKRRESAGRALRTEGATRTESAPRTIEVKQGDE
jgi:carbon-monoxide dehydrogenase iron sulfur subunit